MDASTSSKGWVGLDKTPVLLNRKRKEMKAVSGFIVTGIAFVAVSLSLLYYKSSAKTSSVESDAVAYDGPRTLEWLHSLYRSVHHRFEQ